MRINLRFDMQFELKIAGNELLDAKHHCVIGDERVKDEFILQKNIIKINGGFCY